MNNCFTPDNPLTIAEIGSNFYISDNEDTNLGSAINQIHTAAELGFRAVKFQYYSTKELYGKTTDDKYCLPKKWLPVLKEEAVLNGLLFMCSAFSKEGFEVVDEFVNIHKIACPESDYFGLINYVANTYEKTVIVTSDTNNINIFPANVLLISGCSEYPASIKDYVNIKKTSGVSDHTKCFIFPLIGYNLGWYIYEIHVNLNNMTAHTPDRCVSYGIGAAQEYIRLIKTGASTYKNKHKRKCTEFGFYRPII